MKRVLPFIVVFAWIGLSSPSLGGVRLRKVVAPTDPAPGSAGMFTSLVGPPAINNAGDVAFEAYVQNSGWAGSSGHSIWLGRPGALTAVHRAGDPAPGAPAGTVFEVVGSGSLILNDNGWLLFQARLSGQGVGQSNDSGVWAGPPGGFALVAQEGDAIPDLGGAGWPEIGYPHVALNNANQAAVVSGLPSLGAFGRGIFRWDAGVMETVVRTGDAVPGFPDYEVDYLIGYPHNLADSGHTVFGASASDTNGGGDPIIDSLWIGTPQTFSRIAGYEDAAPGFGSCCWWAPMLRSINNQGRMAVYSMIYGTGGTCGPCSGLNSSNDEAIFTNARGAWEFVAREGQPAPGVPGATFALLSAGETYYSVLNDAGQYMFAVYLRAETGLLDPAASLWLWDAGQLKLIARPGDAIPGAAGVRFDGVAYAHLNNHGRVAIDAHLSGAGIPGGTNRGILLTDENDQLTMVVKPGDSLEVRPGVFQTVAAAYLPGAYVTGLGRCFNDSGEVVFSVYTIQGGAGAIFMAKLTDTIAGDTNCDGTVNPFDIQPFVTALSNAALYEQQYPECSVTSADANGDGTVNPFDIQAFIELLSGP